MTTSRYTLAPAKPSSGAKANPRRIGTLDLNTILNKNKAAGVGHGAVPAGATGQQQGVIQLGTARVVRGPQMSAGHAPNTARVPKPPSAKVRLSAVASSQPQAAAAVCGGTASTSEHAMPPARALAANDGVLTPYEHKEIFQFPHVYFVGPKASKIYAPRSDKPNDGYDDERGDYNVVMRDHIGYRYEVLSAVGRGSFGQVLKAHDHKTGHKVALKIIRNKKKFHQQALIEVKILSHLKERDPDDKYGCIRMVETFMFRGHMCITFELMHTNLYEYVKETNFQPFADGLLKKMTAQLLVSLAYMYRNEIVHCDIKPENILLRTPGRSAIKLIDFGSSCYERERLYTYIQSRFYRAPEIILGLPYGRPIDMWSLGCVICELAIGFPIFPGENEVEQLACIMEVMGVPPKGLVDAAPRRKQFFDAVGQPKLVPNSKKRIRRPSTRPLSSALSSKDETFLDFVRQLLRWDPSERLTPEQAMRHPWVVSCFPSLGSQLPHITENTAPMSARRR